MSYEIVFCVLSAFVIILFSQARNQEFFRAGEFSRNQSTSINISFTTHARKAPQGKNMVIFLLETPKTTFEMRNSTQDGHNQGIFFPNLGHFFPNFWKRAGETSPLPPSSSAPVSTGWYKSAFSTYLFSKTRFSSFCVLVFRVSVSLAFNS